MSSDEFSRAEIKYHDFSTADMRSRDTESSEETIGRVLSAYDIGRKLRQLRLRKKIALVDLGRHTGLSASMLSQLENGKLVPTLATLARISMVFDVGLEHFFGNRRGQKTFALVRAAERLRFPERADAPKPAYFFECLAFAAQSKGLQAYVAEFPPRRAADVQEHFHEGAELIFVLEGSLAIRFEGEDHILQQGDSVYFDSSEPHSYRGVAEAPARAIVVTTPPRL
uniref:Transcriptional regulator, XRE family n=1 Tax=Solibacter usitatus (strain Ellin6076) TaxID=234267 RepID=Q026G4_SOLUE